MIVVIDYNVGNVKSVCNAFDYLGCEESLSGESKAIEEAQGLVLPGVAAFGYARAAWGEVAELMKEVAQAGKPLLAM